MRKFVALMLVLSALPPALAMGGKEQSEAIQPLSIRVGALKGPTGIGMIKLFDQAPVLPDAVTATFEAVANADAMAARLLSGELDAAVLPVNMAAKLYNAGLQYKMVALVGNGMVKILTNDASIQIPADLKNREVHVAGQGATPEFLLRTVLPQAGADPDKDITMAFGLPYAEMATMLAAGKIEIAVLPEPFATVARKANPSLREPFSLTALWKLATGQDDYPMSVFVVRASLINDRKTAVAALLSAYRDAISWAQADPQAAGLLVERYDLGLKAPIAAAAIPASNYVFQTAPSARVSIEALLAVFLKAVPASIGGKLPDPAFYADCGL
ncbi:MAG: ABC transporter substrate-binding protein [Spirochaetales bacterium]|nr:ABC transporter substrate-binding protein [Spirochaetales bacterium]